MKNLETFNNDLKKGILSESAFNNLLSKNEKSLFDNEKDNDKKNSTICKEKISIIIPTYNRIEQLNECIKSIIRQTYSNFEILIIDDSSNNDTEKNISIAKTIELDILKMRKI